MRPASNLGAAIGESSTLTSSTPSFGLAGEIQNEPIYIFAGEIQNDPIYIFAREIQNEPIYIFDGTLKDVVQSPWHLLAQGLLFFQE